MAQDLLVAAGCERGCSSCYRSCAVAQIGLAWWSDKLRDLISQPRPAGVDRSLSRRRIAEAQGHVARLQAKTVPLRAPQSKQRPALRLIQGGRA